MKKPIFNIKQIPFMFEFNENERDIKFITIYLSSVLAMSFIYNTIGIYFFGTG